VLYIAPLLLLSGGLMAVGWRAIASYRDAIGAALLFTGGWRAIWLATHAGGTFAHTPAAGAIYAIAIACALLLGLRFGMAALARVVPATAARGSRIATRLARVDRPLGVLGIISAVAWLALLFVA
jgi:hypothetical protein